MTRGEANKVLDDLWRKGKRDLKIIKTGTHSNSFVVVDGATILYEPPTSP